MSELMYLFTAEVIETEGDAPKRRKWAFPPDHPIGAIMEAVNGLGAVVSVSVKAARFSPFEILPPKG